MKYPKRVTVIELENAPFRCAKGGAVFSPRKTRKPAFAGHGSRFGRIGVRAINRLSVRHSVRFVSGEASPDPSFTGSKTQIKTYCGVGERTIGNPKGFISQSLFQPAIVLCLPWLKKRNIEVLKGNAGVEPLPSNKTSMDVGILLNGVCDVNGEPLLKNLRVKN